MPTTKRDAATNMKAKTKRAKTAPPAQDAIPHANSTAFKDAVAAAVQAAIPALVRQLKVVDNTNMDGTDDHPTPLQPQRVPVPRQAAEESQAQNTPAQATQEVEQSVQMHLHDLTGERVKVAKRKTSLPVDHHLTSDQRVKIASHQYIEFHTLTKKSVYEKKTYVMKIKNDAIVVEDSEEALRDKVFINTWLSQYTVYATVMVRAHPELAADMFHYMDYVRFLHTQSGYDWAKYDMSFRKLHASDPQEYPFDRDMIDLQMRCEKKKERVAQGYSGSNQYSVRQEGKPRSDTGYSTPYSRNSEPPFPYGTCWAFQRGQNCPGCDWPDTHKCCHCQGAHPGSKCFKNNRNAQTTSNHTEGQKRKYPNATNKARDSK